MMIMMLITKMMIMIRWYVEYQKNNDCVVIGETEPNQSVYLFKCENSTVQVLMMMVEVMMVVDVMMMVEVLVMMVMMLVEVMMMMVTNQFTFSNARTPNQTIARQLYFDNTFKSVSTTSWTTIVVSEKIP